jgi:hypothetical protein
MKATQNESDVTNGFGDHDIVLAVCTVGLHVFFVFFVILIVAKLFAIFVRYRMAEFHFRSMEASQKKFDVTI